MFLQNWRPTSCLDNVKLSKIWSTIFASEHQPLEASFTKHFRCENAKSSTYLCNMYEFMLTLPTFRVSDLPQMHHRTHRSQLLLWARSFEVELNSRTQMKIEPIQKNLAIELQTIKLDNLPRTQIRVPLVFQDDAICVNILSSLTTLLTWLLLICVMFHTLHCSSTHDSGRKYKPSEFTWCFSR